MSSWNNQFAVSATSKFGLASYYHSRWRHCTRSFVTRRRLSTTQSFSYSLSSTNPLLRWLCWFMLFYLRYVGSRAL